MTGFIPRPQQPFLDRNGLVDPIWRDYLRSLTPSESSAELQQQVNQLGLRVRALESADEAGIGTVAGRNSLVQYGRLADGTVYLELVGDEPTPEPLRYYGTDADGVRGFHPRMLATLADVDLSTLTDGQALVWDETAEAWVPGASGAGAAWRVDSGVPDNSLGANGDFYLDADTGDVYEKAAGAYSVVANIEGPQGPEGPPGDEGPAGPPGPSSSCFPTATFGGGSGDIPVGLACDLYVPFGFDVTKATLVGNAAGTLQIDVRAVSYAAFPPGPGDSICGASPPTLTGTNKSQDATLAGWSPSIPSGSVVRFIVMACSGVQQATLVLEGARS